MADSTKVSPELEAMRLRYPNAEFLPIDQNPIKAFGPAGPKNQKVHATFTVLDINKDQAAGNIRSARAMAYDDPALEDVMFNFTTTTLLPAAKAAFAEAGEHLRDITDLAGRQLEMTAVVNSNWVQTTKDRGAGIKEPVQVVIDGVKCYVWGTQHTASVNGGAVLVTSDDTAPATTPTFRKNLRSEGVLWAAQNRAYSNISGANADPEMARSFASLAVE